MRPSEKNKKIAAKLAHSWCSTYLKRSRYQSSIPKILIITKNLGELRGYYKEGKNLIVVYTKNHGSILDICRTVIHEWKHYQQNISMMYDTYLTKYSRNLSNHPYEVTAENFAIKNGLACRKWVNSMMKNK